MSSYIQYSTTWLGTQVQDNTQNYTDKKNDTGSSHIFFQIELTRSEGVGDLGNELANSHANEYSLGWSSTACCALKWGKTFWFIVFVQLNKFAAAFHLRGHDPMKAKPHLIDLVRCKTNDPSGANKPMKQSKHTNHSGSSFYWRCHALTEGLICHCNMLFWNKWVSVWRKMIVPTLMATRGFQT